MELELCQVIGVVALIAIGALFSIFLLVVALKCKRFGGNLMKNVSPERPKIKQYD